MQANSFSRKTTIDGSRTEFARAWNEKAMQHQQTEEFFSAYFTGYIALVIAATDIARHNINFNMVSEEHYEYKSLLTAFELSALHIDTFLNSEDAKIFKNRLLLRSIDGDFRIIGPGKNEDDIRPVIDQLTSLWEKANITFLDLNQKKQQANCIRELFRAVRNRLFHGDKDYRSTEDADLLQSLNPLLIGIVKTMLPN